MEKIMKAMNELETQLRSWMARRPSARLERQLFRPKRAKPSISAWPGLLAPVTACLLVAIAVLNQHGQVVASSDGTLIAMSLSNQNYAAYLPGSFQRANNRLDTFGW